MDVDALTLIASLCFLVVAASGTAVAGPSATTAGDVVSTSIDGVASVDGNTSATDTERVSVIITFENDTARERALQDGLDVNVTGGEDVDIVPVLYADMPEDAIDELAARPGVQSVKIDRQVAIPSNPDRVGGTTTLQASGQIVPWGIDQINADQAAAKVPSNLQENVTVAVLDSGIDYRHTDLDGNVVWGADFTFDSRQDGLSAADDNNGHGTAVAGIIAAEDNNRGVVGVAPNVQLYSMKVTASDGTGQTSWLLSAIDASIKGPDGQLGTDDDADVISMSVGFPSSYSQFENEIQQASNHAVLVSSAGNNGDGSTSTNEVTYPAKYSETIAVAATNQNDATTSFSAEGSEIEVAAPGYRVETTRRGSSTRYFSGTSAAAPYVSGAIALLIADDLQDGSRDSSAFDLRQRLRDTAKDIESPGVDKRSGFGLIQVDEAVKTGDPVGNITGTVVTTDGSEISGATVELANDSSVIATTASDGQGEFSFRDLPAGQDYTLIASYAGESGSTQIQSLSTGTTDKDVVVLNIDGPEFNVSNLSPSGIKVTEGATVGVTADVTNRGDLPGRALHQFTVNGSGIATRAVSLDSGQTKTVDFGDIDTSDLGPGTYTYQVSAPVDSQSATLTVAGTDVPSDFSVSNLTAPGSVGTTELFTVSATITNNGGNGTQTVEYRRDGQLYANETISLAANEGTTVRFTNRSVGQITTTTHGVFTENDTETKSLISSDTTDPVYDPGSPAAQYDRDTNGSINISELSTAATAYSNGQIEIGELAAVARAYARS